MSQYEELVKALRCCSKDKCGQCPRNKIKCFDGLLDDAADAIVYLVKDRDFWKDAAIKAKEG